MYNVPSCFTFGNCEERSEFYPGKIPQHEWKRPAGNGSLCSALRRRGYYYSPQISTTGLGNNFSTFNHIQVRGSSHWMVFYWLAVGWRGGGEGRKGGGGEQHLWNYFIQAGKQYSTSQPTRPRIGNLTHSKLPALPSIPVLG